MGGNQISSAMMELLKGEMADTLTFEHQTPADLDQAAPAQDTYYPILDTTKNSSFIMGAVLVGVADEDLTVRVTIDGNTITGSVTATYDNLYYIDIEVNATCTGMSIELSATKPDKAFILEGRSIKVEVKKTTANGAGNLKGIVIYAKRAIPTT